jgi:hypothetical protein
MYEMRVVVKGLGKALSRVPDELNSLYIEHLFYVL